MNPLFRIDFSISDSLKIVRKSVLIYETIITDDQDVRLDNGSVIFIQLDIHGGDERHTFSAVFQDEIKKKLINITSQCQKNIDILPDTVYNVTICRATDSVSAARILITGG